jgi:hypothetical protein
MPAAVPAAFAPSGFASVSGTSFAAPIVAGAIAWIWTVRPELDKTQVMELVRRTARDVEAPGRDPDTGFGVLDIPAALSAPAPPRDPAEPNDAVELVRPGARVPKPALTAPGRVRTSLTARVDAFDDPRDVYRFYVPAGRRVVATLRSTRGVELAPIGVRPAGLAVQTARAGSTRTLTATNRSRRGAFAFLNAFLRQEGAFPDGSYTLTLRTTAAARR